MTRRPPRPSAVAGAGAAWSALYAAMAAFWALGGAGFPFGDGDPEAADMGSLFVGANAAAVAAPLAVVCAAAAVVARAMTTPGGTFLPRRLVLAVGGFTALLLLAIPDVRLMRDFAYLIAGGAGFVEKFDWPATNQMLCLAGGLVGVPRRSPINAPRAGPAASGTTPRGGHVSAGGSRSPRFCCRCRTS